MDDQTTGRATEVMSNMVHGVITYEINPYYILNKQNNSKLEKLGFLILDSLPIVIS